MAHADTKLFRAGNSETRSDVPGNEAQMDTEAGDRASSWTGLRHVTCVSHSSCPLTVDAALKSLAGFRVQSSLGEGFRKGDTLHFGFPLSCMFQQTLPTPLKRRCQQQTPPGCRMVSCRKNSEKLHELGLTRCQALCQALQTHSFSYSILESSCEVGWWPFSKEDTGLSQPTATQPVGGGVGY